MVDFGIGEVALAATVLSAATSTAGALYTGAAQSAAYNYQAGIATMNAQIARQNAAYESALGESQAQLQGMKTRAQISQTRAIAGASGLDVNTGTPAAVRESELELGQYDQAVIRGNAARRAYGYEVEAVGDTAQAQLDRMAGDTSRTSGYLGAATSILGGVGSFSSRWMQGKSLGLFGGAATSDPSVAFSGPLAGAW